MLNSRIVFSVVTLIFITSLFTSTLLADPQKNKGKPEKTSSEKSVGKQGIGVDTNLSVMVIADISIDDARELASK